MKQRILIVGAGFSGMWSALSATRMLEKHSRNDVEIEVMAPQAELHVRPRFYESDVHRMVASLDELLAAVDVTFVKGMAEHIDVSSRVVIYRNAQFEPLELAYDRLLAACSKVVRPALAGIEHTSDVDQLDEESRSKNTVRDEAKARKQLINSVWIYPPAADRHAASQQQIH
ncbi:hypothetical protein [Stutzerimonas xanthomarina]|uniref:Pyridine nucleotide-disulphide oxidoreductase n=2 Tax=Stutzerimonas xanthomarina TaxID=271420 RepID=A0A1M5S7M6_9GAMM|nr:hypothetical protein [Stutzerimonas xanthomarina]MCP9340690.1 hypothetical protein [Stutzerimonas xanthomarina]SEH98460.1 NADH dehydrogenase [Stutzerimonas xanthomarina]SHH33933.1 hypothetical protein SAMN02744645_3303 [Stutzerimonas xanthomarina DSM 18231]